MARGAWRKLGRVLEPEGGPLARTHVMLPTPHVMADRVRVFFASCDEDQRGRVFFADFAPEPPFRLIGRSAGPVLDVGPPGAFDCDGVNPSQALIHEDRLLLFYIGWRRGAADAPYTLIAGLAHSDDQGRSFTRRNGPLLPPRPGERLFRTAAFLVRDGDVWRLLYIGGDRFVAAETGRVLPVYSLMTLESRDLLVWEGPGRELIAPDVGAGEVGFGRPVVIPSGADDGRDLLMLSLRTRSGYTLVETPIGFEPGTRPPLTPVIPEPFGDWEAGMTCFGAPCTVGDYELLFYNGDGYGRSGMGLCWRAKAKG